MKRGERAAVLFLGVLAASCRRAPEHGVTPEKMADALHAALAADRATYAREGVERLQDQEGVIKASEHFRDDKALPLPAQMFRMGAEAARRSQGGVTYALLSPWPINGQNGPRTALEKASLSHVTESGE